MRRGIRATMLALALCLVLPALAHGATRYASPAGDDSDTNCPMADPCDIATALDSSLTSDGDVVILASGTYTASATLSVEDDIVVTGGPGVPPTVTGSVADAILVGTELGTVTFRRLGIVNTHASGGAVRLGEGGQLDRVEAIAAGDGCEVHGPSSVVLNSICASSGESGLYVRGTSAGHDAVSVVNVTAVGDSDGIEAESSGGGLLQVDVANTISRTSGAGATDVDVKAVALPGAAVVLDIASSSYATTAVAGLGTSEINDDGGQQVAAPAFVGAAGADYRQAAGSPTINSGDNSQAQGTVDIDGEPRIQDGTVDIGADERNVPPSVQITSGPAQGEVTNDSTTTFGLLASEFLAPMSCKVDASIFAPCSSPHASHTTATLSDGEHTFQVFAQDPLTNEPGPVTTRNFSVDTAAPETRITRAPKRRLKTRKRKVRVAFRLRADEAASFECRLTGKGGWRKCTSPKRYRIRAKAKPKRYVFKVRATDRATNRDATPAKHVFKVRRKR